MHTLKPAFIARITLYATAEGGRKSPTPSDWFGCPIKFRETDLEAWDCRLLIGGEPLAPGDTRDVGIVFLSPEIGPAFALTEKFLLWDGRIIGEGHKLGQSPRQDQECAAEAG